MGSVEFLKSTNEYNYYFACGNIATGLFYGNTVFTLQNQTQHKIKSLFYILRSLCVVFWHCYNDILVLVRTKI